MLWVFPKPLCILFSDTKGIQWVDTDATEAIEIIRKEGLSIPVRAFYSKKRTALEYFALKKKYISFRISHCDTPRNSGHAFRMTVGSEKTDPLKAHSFTNSEAMGVMH